MVQETTIMFSVECDCPLLVDDEPSNRVLEWVITSPELPCTSERMPFNLAILIDCSGSMRGEKLHLARQLAQALVNRLGEDDRAALISFADVPCVLAPAQFVSTAHRRAIDTGLDMVQAGGRTNLAGALQMGYEALQLYTGPMGVTRIIVLSDGLADCGFTGVRELAAQARTNRDAGVQVSTIGIGPDRSVRLLETVALTGGGRCHCCGYAGAIADIARYELERLHTVIACDARLTIKVPEEATLIESDLYPHVVTADGYEISLGALCAGERRLIYTRLRCTAAAAGMSLRIHGTLTYTCADHVVETGVAVQTFRYVPVQQLDDRAGNIMVALRAAEAELVAHARNDVSTYPISQDDVPRVCEPSAAYEARLHLLPRVLLVPATRPAQSAADDVLPTQYIAVIGASSIRQ